MYKILGLNEACWDDLIQAGMDPDTYVFGQCADAVRGVNGKVDVYMGIGVKVHVRVRGQIRLSHSLNMATEDLFSKIPQKYILLLSNGPYTTIFRKLICR